MSGTRMSRATPVLLISIFEQIEPRDRGEICITLGHTVIARKFNIPLYGTHLDSVVAFVADAVAQRPELKGAELRFDNVCEALAVKIRQAVRTG
jgi:hypothetical protein